MSQPTSSPSVTLRDIAKSLGICHATVSLALRNSPQISPTRRAQILEACQRLGYRPNPMASALGHQRNRSRNRNIAAEIAWINFWPDPKQLHDYKEFDAYWKGASAVAEKQGYRLECFTMKDYASLKQLEKILRARNIQGVLIPPHRHWSPEWHFSNWDEFCVIRFGYSIPFPEVYTVTSDQLHNSLLAYNMIQERGYHRIGYVTSALKRTRFRAGFLLAQADFPAKRQVLPLVLPTEEQNQDGQKQLARWLATYRPDAILTDIALLRQMLEAEGYHVPTDIGLATLSVLDGNASAGIFQNSEEIGKTATEMLISLINSNYEGFSLVARETLIHGHWVDGDTLPRLDKRSMATRNLRKM